MTWHYHHLSRHAPSITFTGDVQAGKRLIKTGLNQLAVLDESMQFNGIDIGKLERRPVPGAVITTRRSHGLGTVEIYVDPNGGKQQKERETPCFCFPHFSLGIIRKITPSDPDATFQNFGRFKHDVDVCKGKGYTLKKDVYAAGWERYYVGQYVLVTIGAKLDKPPHADFDRDRSCLMHSPKFDNLVISPLHLYQGMRKWDQPYEVPR